MASLSKNSKFTYILRAKYPSFIERRNKQEVKCTICYSFVLIRYKGAADIDKYINAEKHKNKTDYEHQQASWILLFLSKVIIKVVKYHQFYKTLNCTLLLLKKLFSDFEFARNLSYARTNTEAIITNIIAPYTIEILLQNLYNVIFLGLLTDASNHNANKIFPVII